MPHLIDDSIAPHAAAAAAAAAAATPSSIVRAAAPAATLKKRKRSAQSSHRGAKRVKPAPDSADSRTRPATPAVAAAAAAAAVTVATAAAPLAAAPRPPAAAGASAPAPSAAPSSVPVAIPAPAPGSGPAPSPSAPPHLRACSPAPASADPAPKEQRQDQIVALAREAIEVQFNLEILTKHDEIRLINQELAKCQIALEQLRRCHLIPYPINCPTPQQMLNIADGVGPPPRPRPGQPVPKWAPPFGVVDGPYARHYAKWLIPDPVFDGLLHPAFAAAAGQSDAARDGGGSTAPEGRVTRNSLSESSRRRRGSPSGRKLQPLPTGATGPPAKDKNAPCTLKRSDGVYVKLVCLICDRENFSSTQGFINHCRIAHRREFKSHNEAASAFGVPVDRPADPAAATAAGAGASPQGRAAAPAAASVPPSSSLVHPFNRPEMTDGEAYRSLLARLKAGYHFFQAASGSTTITSPVSHKAGGPRPRPQRPSTFVPSAATPHLSRFLRSRDFQGNLDELVKDATRREDVTQVEDADETEVEDEDETEVGDEPAKAGEEKGHPEHAEPASAGEVSARRTARTRRVPARRTGSPLCMSARTAPLSIVTPAPRIGSAQPAPERGPGTDETEMDEHEQEHLTPNTATSNHAPSLVSDDGEYDESDDGSSDTEMSRGAMPAEPDLPDITIREDHDHDSSPRGLRGLRHHHKPPSVSGAPVRFNKEDEDQEAVTLVGSVRNRRRAGGLHGRREVGDDHSRVRD